MKSVYDNATTLTAGGGWLVLSYANPPKLSAKTEHNYKQAHLTSTIASKFSSLTLPTVAGYLNSSKTKVTSDYVYKIKAS